MIVKYTATYSDGSTFDFLSLEDLIAHDGAPELHPDVGVTQTPLPAEASAHEEAPAEEVVPAPEEATVAPAEEVQQ